MKRQIGFSKKREKAMAAKLGNALLKKRGKANLLNVIPEELDNTQGTKEERLHQLWDKWYGCTRCHLSTTRDPGNDPNDIVFGEGSCEAKILVVGEGPGEEEEDGGVPFLGDSGRLLNNLMAQGTDDPETKQVLADYHKVTGMQADRKFHEYMIEWRKRDFFLINTVACRPPENRVPNATELKECWNRVWNVINILDPLLIVACGNTALAVLTKKNTAHITKQRGNIHDIEIPGRVAPIIYPVFPVFHPAYLLRKADFKIKGGDWEKSVEDWKNITKTVRFLEKHGV